METLMELAISTVASHPSVTTVELAGSRSRGTHDELSDWDFAVTTTDFAAVARDLPALAAALEPVGALWEPLGRFPVYSLVLHGPTVVEYLFLDHSQEPERPVTPSADTLQAIDTHFWHWLWWLATKASIGRSDLLEQPVLHRHLLAPIGVDAVPRTIQAASTAFRLRRGTLERNYGIVVPRTLEREVREGIRRLRLDA